MHNVPFVPSVQCLRSLRSLIRTASPRCTYRQCPRTVGNGAILRHRILDRGLKTETTVHLDDLLEPSLETQAAIQKEPLRRTATKDAHPSQPAYPTVVQQVLDNMRKYEKCVVLTRVGSFYELYFDQAEKFGPLLNLKVAQKKTAAGPVPMAGFPFYQLDRFLKILVQDLHQFVAISEEFANNASGTVKSGGLLFDRRVTRTITPGTLIDERFLDPHENNFLLALHVPEGSDLSGLTRLESASEESLKSQEIPTLSSSPVGLAWLDLSTGDFFTQSISLSALPSAAAKIGAKEILLQGKSEDPKHMGLLKLLDAQIHSVTYHSAPDEESSISSWAPMLERPVDPSISGSFSEQEVLAGSFLLSYVRERLPNSEVRLQPPVRRQHRETMSIDKNSMRALEILGTSKDGSSGGKGSLFHTIRKTVTKSGSRLLRDRIASPSMSLEVINERLDLVTLFRDDPLFRNQIAQFLRQTFDSQRLVQKFSMGRGDADDLVSLLKTIEITNVISERLEEYNGDSEQSERERGSSTGLLLSLGKLRDRLSLEGPSELAKLIAQSIDEDGLMESHRIEETSTSDMMAMAQEVLQSEGSQEDQSALSRISRAKSKPKSTDPEEDTDTWILRKNASEVLERLHYALATLKQQKIVLTSQLRDKMSAQSLTLRWTPGLGYICHVKGVKDVTSSLRNSTTGREAKTTKSTRAFHHPDWTGLGNKIDQAKLRIKAEEQRVLQQLREQVVKNLVKLRRNATVLDELDVGCSFATVADEQGFARPVLDSSLRHNISEGRHPTVKQGLEEQGRAFISNDLSLGEKERIWLITGPNMAGKSTFLRQNALISILAQVGSFVPAKHSEIGLVDQMFTRVGSADNLFKDQSTFMVEMMETATILNEATPQSFVIMDEIGRGTTPEDGIAIGFACLHHLYHKNRSRTLFATHFHSLADMTENFEHLGCYCTDVIEGPDASFSFLHRLRQGVNRSSHALKVARLAGMPEAALETARGVLDTLQVAERPSEQTT